MDSVRELVVGRLAEIGETLKSASEKLGRNHAYLQQFVQRGTPARLPEDVRRELAALLGGYIPRPELAEGLDGYVVAPGLRETSPALAGALALAGEAARG